VKQLEKAAKEMEAASKKIAEGAGAGAQEMAQAAEAMQKAMTAGKQNVQLVDFRELKALLPETLSGLKRVDITGERSGAFGMSVSKAEARYAAGDGGASVRIEITDMGGMPGVAAMAQFGWMAADIDRENDDGYERTTTIAGHKAFEQYSKGGRSGSIQAMVKSRFMVEVRGDEVEVDALHAALKALPLDKLAGLQ
jgi:hypothetical protein